MTNLRLKKFIYVCTADQSRYDFGVGKVTLASFVFVYIYIVINSIPTNVLFICVTIYISPTLH